MDETEIKALAIEKGFELAKDFLGKIISPSVEEIGLLMADNIRYFRFKNQIKILNKAQNHIAEKGISIKQIPVKILVPLLENASLEEDEELQNKWSNMICNMVDSKSNFTNHIFPYILGQISNEEFTALKVLYKQENEHWIQWKKLHDKREAGDSLTIEDEKIQEKLKNDDDEGFFIGIDDFEFENLIRLGLIRKLPPKITIEEFKTGGQYLDSGEEYHNLKAGYELYSSFYRITELGNQFVKICSINNK